MWTETGPPLVPGKPSGHRLGNPPAPCGRLWCRVKEALAPCRRPGATEVLYRVAVDFATDEVESWMRFERQFPKKERL